MIDWSLDDNRERLRESVQGREKEIAELFDAEGTLMLEFVQQVGIGQYTHYLFVEWLAENYPERLAQAASDLTAVPDAAIVRSGQLDIAKTVVVENAAGSANPPTPPSVEHIHPLPSMSGSANSTA